MVAVVHTKVNLSALAIVLFISK